MFGLTTADYQKRQLRKRKNRLSRKRVLIIAGALALIGSVTNASAPSATLYEDCSIAPAPDATQAQRDAYASFNAIPDTERVSICTLISPEFLESFAD